MSAASIRVLCRPYFISFRLNGRYEGCCGKGDEKGRIIADTSSEDVITPRLGGIRIGLLYVPLFWRIGVLSRKNIFSKRKLGKEFKVKVEVCVGDAQDSIFVSKDETGSFKNLEAGFQNASEVEDI